MALFSHAETKELVEGILESNGNFTAHQAQDIATAVSETVRLSNIALEAELKSIKRFLHAHPSSHNPGQIRVP